MALIEREASPPVIEADEIYRFFHTGDEETFALRGVSLAVDAGEVVAIVGPSGSGKSTLLGCLAGLDEPDGGRVRVLGRRITRCPESERAAIRGRLVGVLLQTSNLIEHLSVAQNVQVASTLAAGRPSRPPTELLDEVGLRSRWSAAPSVLSGGEAARAGLAVALANDPAVILADEPTGELDTENEDVVLSLLRRCAEGGSAVVVVTHSERVARAADRSVLLVDGRIAGG